MPKKRLMIVDEHLIVCPSCGQRINLQLMGESARDIFDRLKREHDKRKREGPP